MYANALVDLQDACARDQAGGGAPLAAKLPVNMATGLFNVRFAAMCTHYRTTCSRLCAQWLRCPNPRYETLYRGLHGGYMTPKRTCKAKSLLQF